MIKSTINEVFIMTESREHIQNICDYFNSFEKNKSFISHTFTPTKIFFAPHSSIDKYDNVGIDLQSHSESYSEESYNKGLFMECVQSKRNDIGEITESTFQFVYHGQSIINILYELYLFKFNARHALFKHDNIHPNVSFLNLIYDTIKANFSFMDVFLLQRTVSYKLHYSQTDTKQFIIQHHIDSDFGYKLVLDESFNIVDIYFKQDFFDKYKDMKLNEKIKIFNFFAIYFCTKELREIITTSYKEISNEEIDGYLEVYHMMTI